jgi:hypothetical protein
MTDENALLLQEYKENNQRIEELRSVLNSAGHQMSVLGNQLQRNPMKVTVEGGEFFITDEFYVSNMGGVAAIEYRTLSAETIEQNLSQLKARKEKKQTLEDRLRGAGLSGQIET